MLVMRLTGTVASLSIKPTNNVPAAETGTTHWASSSSASLKNAGNAVLARQYPHSASASRESATSGLRPRNPNRLSSVPELMAASAPGYCSSAGGSTYYEYIQNVQISGLSSSGFDIRINVYIANPTNCKAGQSCGTYDPNPESVTCWADWNGDNTWSSSDQIVREDLTGYNAINYFGVMSTMHHVNRPSQAKSGATWIRCNLGWGSKPSACQYSWSYGNVVDTEVFIDGPTCSNIAALGIGTPKSLPTTGKVVRLTASIDLSSDEYQIEECRWTGDLALDGGATFGSGDKNNLCQFDYTPRTGPGPSAATYGPKSVKLMVKYSKQGGELGKAECTGKYKVFFELKGEDEKGTPNVCSAAGAWLYHRSIPFDN